jgi:hypothetical protein
MQANFNGLHLDQKQGGRSFQPEDYVDWLWIEIIAQRRYWPKGYALKLVMHGADNGDWERSHALLARVRDQSQRS